MRKWTCASLKPGRTSLPFASMTRVFGPANGRSCALEPTATIRLPRTATASAVGCAASIVWTEALTMSKSGASDGSLAWAESMARERMAAASVFIDAGSCSGARQVCHARTEASNSKLQTPGKLQAPTPKPLGRGLEFGAFLEFGVWSLEFGVSSLSFPHGITANHFIEARRGRSPPRRPPLDLPGLTPAPHPPRRGRRVSARKGSPATLPRRRLLQLEIPHQRPRPVARARRGGPGVLRDAYPRRAGRSPEASPGRDLLPRRQRRERLPQRPDRGQIRRRPRRADFL